MGSRYPLPGRRPPPRWQESDGCRSPHPQLLACRPRAPLECAPRGFLWIWLPLTSAGRGIIYFRRLAAASNDENSTVCEYSHRVIDPAFFHVPRRRPGTRRWSVYFRRGKVSVVAAAGDKHPTFPEDRCGRPPPAFVHAAGADGWMLSFLTSASMRETSLVIPLVISSEVTSDIRLNTCDHQFGKLRHPERYLQKVCKQSGSVPSL